jgi:hypothetical protein
MKKFVCALPLYIGVAVNGGMEEVFISLKRKFCKAKLLRLYIDCYTTFICSKRIKKTDLYFLIKSSKKKIIAFVPVLYTA